MNRVLLLTAVCFSLLAFGAAAEIPKAAENSKAPVTYGADAPKPKKNKARHNNPSEKKKPAKKSAKKVKSPKTTRP